jgi:AmiR/NasT family two-component response regulator
MSSTEERGARRARLPLEEAAARLHELLEQPETVDGALEEARALSGDLFQALPNRFVIERAKGVVMGATGCDAEEAFTELRRESQRTNRPLRDVAEEVASSGRLPWATV